MRIIYLLLITLSLSCSENNEVLFIMQTEADFTVPAGLNTIESHFFILRDVPTFFEAVNTVDTSQIAQINSRRAILRPVFNDVDLDHINSVNIFIVNPNNPNDRTEIFFREFIPFGSKTEIEFFGTIVNLKEDLVKDRMLLEVVFDFRRAPIQTTNMRLEMSFSAIGF